MILPVDIWEAFQVILPEHVLYSLQMLITDSDSNVIYFPETTTDVLEIMKKSSLERGDAKTATNIVIIEEAFDGKYDKIIVGLLSEIDNLNHALG